MASIKKKFVPSVDDGGSSVAPADGANARDDFARVHRTGFSRFAPTLDDLRTILLEGEASGEEMLLRAELRRVVGDLGALFAEAATLDGDGRRADDFSRLAAAARSVAATASAVSGRSH
jgi:hypothetical protein